MKKTLAEASRGAEVHAGARAHYGWENDAKLDRRRVLGLVYWRAHSEGIRGRPRWSSFVCTSSGWRA